MANFHQDIGFALDTYAVHDRAAGRQAEYSLKQMLPGYTRLPSHLNRWQDSCLTGDGFPLECAFSASDDGLRYTVDVMPERYQAGHRLEKGIDFLHALNTGRVPAHLIRAMKALQLGSKLAYGCWLGGRHLRHSNKYKLYSEINVSGREAQTQLFKRLHFSVPVRSSRNLEARMLGYNLDSSMLEIYLRGKSIEGYELPLLLDAAGISDRAQELHDFIEMLYGHSINSRLPGGHVGISYAWSRQGEPRGVCLFFPARQFWGSDASIRRKFIHHSAPDSRMLKHYIEMSRPLKQQQGCLTRHGMLGISIAAGQAPQLNIGLRPWAGNAESAERGEKPAHGQTRDQLGIQNAAAH